MMNHYQVGLLLDKLATSYNGVTINDDVITIWTTHLNKLDLEWADAAADNVTSISEYFPTIAKFKEAYAAVAKARTPARKVADPECRLCNGTSWIEVDPAKNRVKPCEACDPILYERWVKWRDDPSEHPATKTRRGPEPNYEYNPRTVLESAREALAAAKNQGRR